MIVFINGAFGACKTTVAKLLCQRIPNSLLFDPEEVGFTLRSILRPVDWSGNYQDYAIWRTLIPIIGEQIRNEYGRILIIPMTIWDKDYFIQVTNGLKRIDVDFYHFCLTAPQEVIHQRIRMRGEHEEGHWIYQ